MTTGENVFGGVENQLYRPPGRFRQMVGDRHVDERRLGAEVAADIDDVNLDLLLRDAEILRHLVAQAPGTLVRGPDLDPPIPVNVNGAGAGLYVAVMGKGRAKRMLENPRRIRKPRLDIAVLPHDMRLQVMTRHAFWQLRRVSILASVLVNQRRARLQCLDRIGHARKLLVFDVDQCQRLLGNRFAVRRHSGDGVADKTHFVVREHRQVFESCADVNVGHIRAGEHRAHAG